MWRNIKEIKPTKSGQNKKNLSRIFIKKILSEKIRFWEKKNSNNYNKNDAISKTNNWIELPFKSLNINK